MIKIEQRAWISGGVAAIGLIALFSGIILAVSGRSFFASQLALYWPYYLLLALGFGFQVTLYLHLQRLTEQQSARMVVASGGVSTASMVACCAHYLAGILPILGAASVSTFITQYQIRFFWVAIAFNALGIWLMARRIRTAAAGVQHA